MQSYLQAAAARTLAATLMALPGVAALVALDDATLGGTLLTASLDIDASMRFQGRKYDPTQDMEFPRVAFGSTPGTNQFGVPLAGPASLPLTPDTVVWDWDFTNNAVIVPPKVQLATLYQAAWLMQPKYAARIEAIKSGLAQQQTGNNSETFSKPVLLGSGDLVMLGARARQILAPYALNTGRML